MTIHWIAGGLSRYEKFWFNKIIGINKVTEKTPATSDLCVMCLNFQ